MAEIASFYEQKVKFYNYNSINKKISLLSFYIYSWLNYVCNYYFIYLRLPTRCKHFEAKYLFLIIKTQKTSKELQFGGKNETLISGFLEKYQINKNLSWNDWKLAFKVDLLTCFAHFYTNQIKKFPQITILVGIYTVWRKQKNWFIFIKENWKNKQHFFMVMAQEFKILVIPSC
jgi:hypothetical protein